MSLTIRRPEGTRVAQGATGTLKVAHASVDYVHVRFWKSRAYFERSQSFASNNLEVSGKVARFRSIVGVMIRASQLQAIEQ